MKVDPQRIGGLLSGRRRDWRAALLRTALWPLQFPYGWAVAWRNRGFDRQRREQFQAAVPVISIGNLTTGGTGKTPLVEWLARWFRARRIRVAIVSRGYKAQEGGRNDEALQLELSLPDVPHAQNPDRVSASRMVVEEFETQLILLDDGFQHRRLRRDLDLVLLDATQPFGYGHLLPRGLLREPPRSLRRAQIVALSRADQVSEAERRRLRQEVQRLAPDILWAELKQAPQQLRQHDGASLPLAEARSRRWAAFCGIGNPEAFRRTLDDAGLPPADLRVFSDHHPYSRDDLRALEQWLDTLGELAGVICTDKDLVKIQTRQIGRHPLWSLQIGVEWTSGGAEVEASLEAICRQAGLDCETSF